MSAAFGQVNTAHVEKAKEKRKAKANNNNYSNNNGPANAANWHQLNNLMHMTHIYIYTAHRAASSSKMFANLNIKAKNCKRTTAARRTILHIVAVVVASNNCCCCSNSNWSCIQNFLFFRVRRINNWNTCKIINQMQHQPPFPLYHLPPLSSCSFRAF